MDSIGSRILTTVTDTNERVEALLRQIDFARLPSVLLSSVEICDRLPPRKACLYFSRHPVHGLLYVGKAKDLRSRWQAEGKKDDERFAHHKHHERCIEIGEVSLSWFSLDEAAHEIAETVAIRCFEPAWNVRKSKRPHERAAGVPSSRLRHGVELKQELVRCRELLNAAKNRLESLRDRPRRGVPSEKEIREAETDVLDLENKVARTVLAIEDECEEFRRMKEAVDRL